MQTNTHYLNLWDDFCQMGDVSEHSITGETHVQIESEGMNTHEEQTQLLNHFLPLFLNFFEPKGVSVSLYLYDTKVLYPHMSDELHARIGWRHYSIWKLKLNSMTYALAEEFMETQKGKVHDYNGEKVVIISES